MARALLTQVVEQDPRNEEAWMWLSGVVTDADEQQICLENALVVNPYNAHARKGLEFILSKTGTPSRVPLAPPQPVQQVAPTATPSYTLPAVMSQPEDLEGEIAPMASVAAPEIPGFPMSAEMSHSDDSSAPDGAASGSAEPVQATPATGNSSNGIANLMSGPRMAYEVDEATGFDAKPFVPPGMTAADPPARRTPSTPLSASVLNTSPEQVGDELPNWLQELTPSAIASASSGNSGPFTPFNMSDYPTHGANSNTQTAHQNTSTLPGPGGQPFHPGEFGSNGANGSGNGPAVAPAGPYADLQMPLPHELPGGMEGFGDSPHHGAAQPQQNDAQPWYLRGASGPSSANGSTYLDSTMLKSTSLNSTMLTSSLVEDKRVAKVVPTIDCPNCHEQVPETALACPNCGYNYFVNCPHCHELVDTSHCVPGEIDPCPYCEQPVEGWKLGLGGVPDLVSQKNPGSRPVGAGDGPEAAFASTKQVLDIDTSRHVRSFSWIVDILWLVAVIAMVWAFTQLPTWFHLSGQF
jgi:hypothetical protein